MFTITIIKSEEEFFNIKDEWNKLLSISRSNNITLTWEWLYVWWKIYGKEKELCIITIKENGVLKGLVPLFKTYRKKVGYFKLFSFKSIEFLASGEEKGDEVCSDYLDIIIQRDYEEKIIPLILDYLTHQLANEWEQIILPDISEESVNIELLKRYSKKNALKFMILKREPCSVIKLPDRWEKFLSSISSSLRYKINRGRKELEERGYKYTEVKKGDNLEEAIQRLIKLHQERWRSKNKPGAFASPQRTAFHKQIIPICMEKGWLNLSFLIDRDTLIGALYNFNYNNKIYFYQSGIIPQENKHIRPGLLLHSYAIQDAINRGLQEYDFLKTGKSDYKFSWANYSRDLVKIRIAKLTPKEYLYEFIENIIDYLRKVKEYIKNKKIKRDFKNEDISI